MRRLRDLLDSDDAAEAEAARLLRAAGDLDPPDGAQARVRDAIAVRGWPLPPSTSSRTEVTGEDAAMRIGPYRVTGVIGQGSTSTLYAAQHVLLGRPAMIKVLSPELSQQRDIVQRFFNEARATTAIRHPGIVQLYDFGWTGDGTAFIVMEQLDGETLAQRAKRGPLGWRAALALARQIASALFAAHARGVVHRDLMPGNVFLTRDRDVPGGERIKLLDFGIAKLTGDRSSAANLTRSGTVLGTPAYMAPEQCRGVAVDHRADLYALGCILFELITGRPPFLGESDGDVLAAHIHAPVPPVATPRIQVPHAVERLVQQLLAKSPDQRVQTADQLIAEIDAITGRVAEAASVASWASHVAPSNTTLSGAAGAHSRSRATPARRPGRMIAIVAAAAVVVIAIAVRHRSGDAPAVEPAAPPPAVMASPGDAAAPSTQAGDAPAEPLAPAPVPPDAPTPVTPPEPPAPGVRTLPHTPPPPSIELAIDSDPPGAQVVVADRVLGTTPLRRTLARHASELTVVVRLAGYRSQTLVIRADRAVTRRVALVPVPPPPARDRSVNPFEP